MAALNVNIEASSPIRKTHSQVLSEINETFISEENEWENFEEGAILL